MVDVEADGPCPSDYSMISFGAVAVTFNKEKFYAKLCPLEGASFIPEALAVSGFSRAETLDFDDPYIQMCEFKDWLKQFDRPMFISDNNGFDWQFINWYFWHFLKENPFGHSSTNLGSLYKGLVKDRKKNFKHLRKTKHTHNPVDDAMGNVEAFDYMIRTMELK